jgi:hypothetical protein
MSAHDTETGKDQNPTEQGLPSIYSQDTVEEQRVQPTQTTPQPPQPPTRSRSTRLFAIIAFTTIIVILLGLSIGFLIYAQRGPHPTQVTPTPNPTATTQPTTPPTATPQPTATPVTPTPTPPPFTGQWIPVLNNYKITSLSSAPSNPNVLYACAVPPGLSPDLAGVQTVLRSADFGNNWQDLGNKAQMSRNCELTINPNNSNEVYVGTSSAPATESQVPSYVLKHTTDGGNTWETFQPTVHGPGLQITLNWRGERLSFAGNRLYSLQRLPIPPMPTPVGHQGPLPTEWTRLVMSTDGGHTWGVLDNQFSSTWQSAGTYTVNPVNTNIIYEIVGLPGATAGGPPQVELYKSADGGNTWQPLLKKIGVTPSVPEVFIASEKPDQVYISNTQCPASQAFYTGGGPLVQPLAGGGFNLCMSSNGGINWKTITAPSGGSHIDPQGRIYTWAIFSPGSAIRISRYDPVSNMWSTVTNVPTDGSLMAVTPTSTNGNVALWFMGTGQGKLVLYRYEEK